MNLADVMDEVAAQLDTIDGLRVYPYPPDSATPPAAFIDYPESYDFDATYGRGMDRMTLPVVVLVSRAYDRAARDLIVAYLAGSGASSVKAVIESGSYTAFDTLRVMSAEVDVFRIASTDYVAAIFDLDIAGQGAS